VVLPLPRNPVIKIAGTRCPAKSYAANDVSPRPACYVLRAGVERQTRRGAG
jgi:hypothetical protein